MIRAASLAALLLLSGCSDPAADDPRKVSGDEQRALDEAAEMIEATKPPVMPEPEPPTAEPAPTQTPG